MFSGERKMNYQLTIPALNIFSCILIMLMTMKWRRGNSRYRPEISFLAWLLSVSCCAVITFLYFGYYRYAEWSESIINFIFAFSIVSVNGDIAHLFKEKK
ncbi:phage holin family protein [Citrobacter braakii]|nr:phage holin family protein [Citrobacter braakii]